MKHKFLLTTLLGIALSTGTAWSDDHHAGYVTQEIDNIGYFENII